MFVTIISFIFVLGVLILVHEFGHFITAKKIGIRVEEFALGFGPKLISRKKGETVYSIRAVPLGGFCSMTGEFPPDEDDPEDEIRLYEEAKKNGRTFDQQLPWERFMVSIMGPVMNFLLAIVLFVIIFLGYGLPVSQSNTTEIGQITPQMPAAEAGLQPGDEIVAVNGEKTENWQEMSKLLGQSEGQDVNLEVKRDNEIFEVNLKTEYNQQLDKAVIGISAKVIREKVGPITAIVQGVNQTIYSTRLIIVGVVDMIKARSAEGLGGPVMIANVVGQAAKSGFENLLNWMAVISINLGIINLLPLPALDGGRLIFIIIEKIRGKALPPEKEGLIHMIGFALLMLLMVFIIYRDIANIFF
ncbi:MAG: RIP metalloprotease RseP [Bacillota bacterium]